MAKTGAVGDKLPKAWQNWRQIAGPDKLSKLAEAAFKKRRERKGLQSKLDALEREEKEIKEHIIAEFSNSQIEGVKTKFGSLSVREKDVPKVTDKEAFGKWVAKHSAWDLLYGKAVEEACAARWEEDIEIDGIEKYHDKKLTLNERSDK